MPMEKRGATGITDVRTLVKMANKEESIIQLNFDGLLKKADGLQHKEAVVIVATGDRAVQLRAILKELCQ